MVCCTVRTGACPESGVRTVPASGTGWRSECQPEQAGGLGREGGVGAHGA